MKKCNIYIIRLIVFSAVLSGALSSCLKDGGIKTVGGEEEPIVIGIGTETRSTPIDEPATIAGEDFGIVAFYLPPEPGTKTTHINTYGRVKHLSGGNYGADLYKDALPFTFYWPYIGTQTGHSLKFLAWYPYNGTGAPTVVTKDADNQKVAMNFTVQNNISAQVDLMAATHTPVWSKNVNLKFHHALTRIRFSFNKGSSTENYTVSSIILKDVVKTASLTVVGNVTNGQTPDFSWEDAAETTDLTWTGSLAITKTTSDTDCDVMNDSFLTIPMDASAVKVVITINSNNVLEEITISDFENVDTDWTSGKYIDYKVTITEASAPEIELESTVIDWKRPNQGVIFDGQYFLKVDKDKLSIPNAGGTVSLTAETNYYTLTIDQGYPRTMPQADKGSCTWIKTLTVVHKGGNEYTISVEAESTVEKREGAIYIQVGNMKKEIHVTQGS